MDSAEYKLLWKFAYFKLGNGIVQTGLMAFIAATAAVTWQNLQGFERFIIIATTVVQVSNYVGAFLDTAASKLLSGKPPIGTNGTGNTDIITKAATSL